MWSIIICQALIYPQHFGYSWKKWKQLESSSPSPLFQYNHSNSFLLLFSYEYRVNPERCRPTVPTITSVVVQILQLLSLYCTKDGQKGAFLQKMQAPFIDKLWKLDGPGMGQYWIKSAPVHQNYWKRWPVIVKNVAFLECCEWHSKWTVDKWMEERCCYVQKRERQQKRHLLNNGLLSSVTQKKSFSRK